MITRKLRPSLGAVSPLLALALGCSGSVSGTPSADDPGITPGPGTGSGTGGSGTAAGGAVTSSGGSATTESGGATAAGGAPASGGATTTSTGGTTVAPSTDACPTLEVARTPLRRLTRFEYKNTVGNLLGVDPSPADGLPADEVTSGFDNNAAILTVSSLHAEKYVVVSEALAQAAVQSRPELTTCASPMTEDECALEFARSFGRRAFRRPTTAEDEQLLMAAYTAGRTDGSYAEGIEVMIRAALQSTHFLYRLETTTPPDPSAQLVPLSPYEIGTRLSYLMWGSGPDDALLDAAAGGQLATREQVAQKAREMLADPRARVAIASFFDQWAGTRRLAITTKDASLFPLYSTEVRDALAEELPAFVDYVVWGADHTLTTLLTAPLAFVTPALAPVYGIAAPAGATAPSMVTLPDNQGRAGILTQAGFLSVQAHPDQTSPVLRGKFVRSMLLCQPPDPPPNDVNISVPEIDPNATARERFSGHLTAGATCNGCHQLMDPIGFAFESYDALGQYRETDAGRPLDLSGEIIGATDPSLEGPFNGVREMAQKLAGSQQVRECLATQWFRFAVGRPQADQDACSLGTLEETFVGSGGDLVELFVGMTQTDAFWYRTPIAP